MTKDFWQGAESEWITERKAEDEEGDYPWSPPHLTRVLEGELELLDQAISQGDVEDCQHWSRCIAALCKVLNDSVANWGYKNGIWWIAYEDEDSIDFYLSDGRQITIKAEQTGAKWTIYREVNGEREELETLSRYEIKRALRDYYQAELTGF